MRISNSQVSQLIKSKGLKNHYLLDKNINDWSDKDHSVFNSLVNNEYFIKETREYNKVKTDINYSRHKVKIVRLSDGYIYNTFSECSKIECIPARTLTRRLDNEIEFKRLKYDTEKT